MSIVHRAAVLVAVLVTSACSGEGRDLPDPEEFAAGTCREAAPAVIALDEQVRRAVDEDVDVAEVRAALESEQQRLIALLGEGAEADEVTDELQDVVTRVGFARAAVNADAIGEAEVDDVTAAVDAFVAACMPASP